MTSQFKTVALLALLSGLIIVLGGAVGGRGGIMIALAFALVMNIGSYWYSDKIVLSMYRARELSPQEAPMLHQIVEELAANAGVPKPRVYLVPQEAPNAFATGRNPENSAVAVTEGIMHLLSPRELRGVLAHEMAHVANRDILIQTVAGVLASAITAIANFAQFAAIFGGRDENGEGRNPLAMLLMALLAPIAATLIQMAISRTREYKADATGAELCRDPLALASALNKLTMYSQRIPMQGNPSTENMFIVSPFSGMSMANLFSTHPPMQERIARLQQMAGEGLQSSSSAGPSSFSGGSGSANPGSGGWGSFGGSASSEREASSGGSSGSTAGSSSGWERLMDRQDSSRREEHQPNSNGTSSGSTPGSGSSGNASSSGWDRFRNR